MLQAPTGVPSPSSTYDGPSAATAANISTRVYPRRPSRGHMTPVDFYLMFSPYTLFLYAHILVWGGVQTFGARATWHPLSRLLISPGDVSRGGVILGQSWIDTAVR